MTTNLHAIVYLVPTLYGKYFIHEVDLTFSSAIRRESLRASLFEKVHRTNVIYL